MSDHTSVIANSPGDVNDDVVDEVLGELRKVRCSRVAAASLLSSFRCCSRGRESIVLHYVRQSCQK